MAKKTLTLKFGWVHHFIRNKVFDLRLTLFALHGLLKAQIPVWPAGVANFKTPPHTN